MIPCALSSAVLSPLRACLRRGQRGTNCLDVTDCRLFLIFIGRKPRRNSSFVCPRCFYLRGGDMSLLRNFKQAYFRSSIVWIPLRKKVNEWIRFSMTGECSSDIFAEMMSEEWSYGLAARVCNFPFAIFLHIFKDDHKLSACNPIAPSIRQEYQGSGCFYVRDSICRWRRARLRTSRG